jgi:23S rRNA (pseudouridine1915-N3)-methyltransferase
MKISLVMIGKFKNDFVKEGCDAYLKRCERFADIDVIEIKEEKVVKDESKVKNIEGKKILESTKDKCLILLDKDGHEMSSEDFASFLKSIEHKHCAFVIGSSLGFSDELYKEADHKISLSKMTFPHQLIRIFFAEQLYRGFTINHNIPYHK